MKTGSFYVIVEKNEMPVLLKVPNGLVYGAANPLTFIVFLLCLTAFIFYSLMYFSDYTAADWGTFIGADVFFPGMTTLRPANY
jgi:hypothetical protein